MNFFKRHLGSAQKVQWQGLKPKPSFYPFTALGLVFHFQNRIPRSIPGPFPPGLLSALVSASLKPLVCVVDCRILVVMERSLGVGSLCQRWYPACLTPRYLI